MKDRPPFMTPYAYQKRISQPGYMETWRIGERSERRAKEVLLELTKLIKQIEPSTKWQDHEGIDFWVRFLQNTAHDPRPIQIKSSQRFIDEFMESPKYAVLTYTYGPVILLNAGPKSSDNDIKLSFLNQIKQIDGFI